MIEWGLLKFFLCNSKRINNPEYGAHMNKKYSAHGEKHDLSIPHSNPNEHPITSVVVRHGFVVVVVVVMVGGAWFRVTRNPCLTK